MTTAATQNCPICLEPLEHPRTTLCAHTFCYTCLDHHFNQAFPTRCPICRRDITRSDISTSPPIDQEYRDAPVTLSRYGGPEDNAAAANDPDLDRAIAESLRYFYTLHDTSLGERTHEWRRESISAPQAILAPSGSGRRFPSQFDRPGMTYMGECEYVPSGETSRRRRSGLGVVNEPDFESDYDSSEDSNRMSDNNNQYDSESDDDPARGDMDAGTLSSVGRDRTCRPPSRVGNGPHDRDIPLALMYRDA